MPSLAGYKTPVDNLWLRHRGVPESFISGWPGRNTANLFLNEGPMSKAKTLIKR